MTVDYPDNYVKHEKVDGSARVTTDLPVEVCLPWGRSTPACLSTAEPAACGENKQNNFLLSPWETSGKRQKSSSCTSDPSERGRRHGWTEDKWEIKGICLRHLDGLTLFYKHKAGDE